MYALGLRLSRQPGGPPELSTEPVAAVVVVDADAPQCMDSQPTGNSTTRAREQSRPSKSSRRNVNSGRELLLNHCRTVPDDPHSTQFATNLCLRKRIETAFCCCSSQVRPEFHNITEASCHRNGMGRCDELSVLCACADAHAHRQYQERCFSSARHDVLD